MQELPEYDTETRSEQRVLEKMVQTDFFNTGLPQILNVQKMQYPQNIIKQRAIKRGMPICINL